MSSRTETDGSSPLTRLVRRLLIVSAALLVPVLPLIVLGLSFEERIDSLLSVEMTLTRRFWLIVGLLSVDLVLPIPSSAVSTYGGGRIGLWPAFAASFLGMTLGSLFGYGLARWLGEPFARRSVGEEDFRRMRSLVDRFGGAALLVTRPLPLLAEACVLLVGAAHLPFRRFLPPVLIANAVISFVYGLFGATFNDEAALPVAIGISAVLPLVIAVFAKRRMRRLPHKTSVDQAANLEAS